MKKTFVAFKPQPKIVITFTCNGKVFSANVNTVPVQSAAAAK